ncbi:glycosyltransferase [Candidatus Saccharibacteria bacterium RAAC3_TM7_1]|nr:glycosyltransferase [Candidatus Saccharibacteria bacterium RAAC3_TM7_1]
MKRVYIDVSDFLVWRGHFTGIQRVLYNVIKEVSGQDNVELIVFSQGEYQVVEQSIDDIVLRGIVSTEEETELATEQRTTRTLAKYIYQRLPTPVQATERAARSRIRDGLSRSTPLARNVLHHWRELRGTNEEYAALHLARQSDPMEIAASTGSQRYGTEVNFAKGDSLLVLGCLWDSVAHLHVATRRATEMGAKLHCLIYDLVPVYAPQVFGVGLLPMYTRYLFEVLGVASSVVTISRSTKKDVERFMKETAISDPPEVTVLRLGDEVIEKIDPRVQKEMIQKHSSPFAICVGTIEARKNHIQLYTALKLAIQEGCIDVLPKIYLIGRQGWLTADLIHLITYDPELNNRVKFMDNVSDQELAWLYQNAELTVYTSQYEGWGLPVAESLAYGTPVITSNVSSMSEIAPDLTINISPFDSRALLDALLFLSNKKSNDALRAKIKKVYRPARWSETVRSLRRAIR